MAAYLWVQELKERETLAFRVRNAKKICFRTGRRTNTIDKRTGWIKMMMEWTYTTSKGECYYAI